MITPQFKINSKFLTLFLFSFTLGFYGSFLSFKESVEANKQIKINSIPLSKKLYDLSTIEENKGSNFKELVDKYLISHSIPNDLAQIFLASLPILDENDLINNILEPSMLITSIQANNTISVKRLIPLPEGFELVQTTNNGLLPTKKKIKEERRDNSSNAIAKDDWEIVPQDEWVDVPDNFPDMKITKQIYENVKAFKRNSWLIALKKGIFIFLSTLISLLLATHLLGLFWQEFLARLREVSKAARGQE